MRDTFSHELNALDIGSLDRCQVVADFVEVIVASLRKKSMSVLDWGGGYGVLTRLLRDRGIKTVVSDPYVDPIFARGFEATTESKFDLVILSEVLLHIPNPIEDLRALLEKSPMLLVTAVVAPKDVDASWWYFMPDSGQHVAIYSDESLRRLSRELGVQLTSDGRFFHLLHRVSIPRRTRLLMKIRPLAFAFAELLRIKHQIRKGLGRSNSLLVDDQNKVRDRLPWNSAES